MPNGELDTPEIRGCGLTIKAAAQLAEIEPDTKPGTLARELRGMAPTPIPGGPFFCVVVRWMRVILMKRRGGGQHHYRITTVQLDRPPETRGG
jgi:hypothetical protein